MPKRYKADDKPKKTKLTDLGLKKSRKEIKKRIQKAATQGQRGKDEELRLLAKAANERMRQLEKADINSPAYQAAQAKLEILGKTKAGGKGRRFSETGKGTYNEREIQKRMIKEFLGAKTSTKTGARNYYDSSWESANNKIHLEEAGITREQWFDFWENMPQKQKDRMYYSNQVKIFKAVMRKNGQLEDENKIKVEDIVDAIQHEETLSKVYEKLGVSLMEVEAETDGTEIDDKK